MSELRTDPLSGRQTIVAAGRADRPGALAEVGPPAAIDPDDDPFLGGHEGRTPPELHAVRPDGSAPDSPGWTVRVVPNRWPLAGPGAPDPPPRARRDLLAAAPAHGAHEVIVSTPDPVTSLGDLDAAHLATVVEVWRERLRAHAGAACRHLWVNERPEGGSSLPHTHAQLLALDHVPAGIARERERANAYANRTMGGDLLADLVQEEVKLRERLVAVDDEAVLLAAYAPAGPFGLLIAPRTSRPRFEDDGPSGAAMLHEALRRLRSVFGGHVPPLNLWVRTAPRGAERFCWRIDVLPRLTPVAGLELGTGVGVCVVAPEDAAARLRDAA